MSRKITYDEWLLKATEKHGDKYVYDDKTRESFNGSHSKIVIFCINHGYFTIEARRHANDGCGCNKCAIEYRAKNNMSSLEEFIEKATKVHGDKYEYIDYFGAKKPSPIICKKHGLFYQKPNDHLSGKGCPICNESHLERDVKTILDENDISYAYRKHFEWLGHQEIDFYLPDYNMAIECQGKQHFGFGGWSNRYDFEKQIALDELKKKLCGENGIDLIYFIDCKISKSNYPSFYDENKCFTKKEDVLIYVKSCNY